MYIGSTRENNAQSRLVAHNKGKTRSTKPYKPWVVVREDVYPDYTEARKRELYLKSGNGRNWLKNQLPTLG
ncbi:MAG: GIY-YIG nuclease family protein [Candidatus Omnitrophica bacterium]|nr:GIY-YIG nuclease family protein [Candidatus Omnitrophota bacterium]